MMHPTYNTTSLTDTEIADKINHIYKVLNSTKNVDVINQARMILESLNTEQTKRSDAQLAKANEHNENISVIDISRK